MSLRFLHHAFMAIVRFVILRVSGSAGRGGERRAMVGRPNHTVVGCPGCTRLSTRDPHVDWVQFGFDHRKNGAWIGY
jgi:hypothetical protein